MKITIYIILVGQLLFCQDIHKLEGKAASSSGNEKAEALINVANYYLKKDPSKSISAANNALTISKELNNPLLIANSTFAKAEYEYLQGNNVFALKYLNQALEIYLQLNDRRHIALTYTLMSRIKRIFGEFDSALDFGLKALNINSEIKDSTGIADDYNELGLIYRNLGDPEKALSYFNIALDLSLKTKNFTQAQRATNYIGNTFFFAGNIEKADSCYMLALEYFEQNKTEDDFYAGILNNLGNCRREKKEYAKAMDYYFKSITISKRLGDKNLIVVTYKNMGVTKKQEKDFPQSLKYLLTADSLAKGIGLKRFERDILLELSKLYQSVNSFENALDYHIKYSILNDSIFHQDMENKIGEYESRFEKQKTQEAITSYKLSQEIYFRNLLIIILLLTVITLALLYYFYRSNKRSNKKFNQQREELLKLNKEFEGKNKQLAEFEDIVNKTKVMIVVWRSEDDYPVEFISKNVKEHLGYDSKDFISGKLNWNDLIHPEDHNRINSELEEHLQNNITEYSQQYRMKNADGDYRWFEDHNKLLIDYNTQVAFLQAAVLDITERKELEQQLYDHTVELLELNKIKDKFFSIVAHDLKSPFFGLLGLSNMLADDFDGIEHTRAKEYVKAMNQLIKRVYKLIENLLDWSRMQLNKYEVKFQEVSVNELCCNVLDIIFVNASQKNISFKNLLPANLKIYTDEKMLSSMFSNLISNAIKFSNENGTVKIYSKSDNKFISITVEDNGVGIPEDELEKIFRIDNKFSTIGTAGEIGTGLGLIITKEMVEKLGGKIFVESQVDKWTKFTFSLPLNGTNY